jgi:hypothetical protein
MYNGEIVTALMTLNPICLEAIDGVRLMNRVETKYLLSSERLVDLINLLDYRYNVLEINNLRVLPYLTTYLDTPDHLFYYQHVRGKLERNKIRYRKYESTSETFLEIKKKTNKGRNIKWRIENNPDSGSFDRPAISFLHKHLSVDSTIIKPNLINRFNRTTLIGLESKERITIDYNISFTEPDSQRKVLMPYLAIVELKKEGYSNCSNFNNIIKYLNMRSSTFSKYCTGIAILNESVKKNMIKSKLLLLNRIENEYTRSYDI